MPFCTSLSRGMEEYSLGSSKPRVICICRIPARYAEMYLDFWSGGGGGGKMDALGGRSLAAKVTLLLY